MKADDLPSAVFMVSVVDLRTGNDVVDLLIWCARLPEIIAFLKGLLHMRIRQEIWVKRAKIARKIITRREQYPHLFLKDVVLLLYHKATLFSITQEEYEYVYCSNHREPA